MRRRERGTEGWEEHSEDFTFQPEFMPGPTGWKMPKCERFWLYHLIYGLSAGFPLCCILSWTKEAAGYETLFGRSPADKRRRAEIGLRHREGHNELGQHFVVCNRETHDESYLKFHVHEGTAFGDDHHLCPYCPTTKVYRSIALERVKAIILEEPCEQCCPRAMPDRQPDGNGDKLRRQGPPGNAERGGSDVHEVRKDTNLQEKS